MQNTTEQQQQETEIQTILAEVRSGWSELKSLPAALRSLQDDNSRLQQSLTDIRRSVLSHSAFRTPHSELGQPSRGRVSDHCARHLAATFIHHCDRSGTLEALSSVPAQRD